MVQVIWNVWGRTMANAGAFCSIPLLTQPLLQNNSIHLLKFNKLPENLTLCWFSFRYVPPISPPATHSSPDCLYSRRISLITVYYLIFQLLRFSIRSSLLFPPSSSTSFSSSFWRSLPLFRLWWSLALPCDLLRVRSFPLLFCPY